MTAEEFVTALRKIPIEVDLLRTRGLTDDDIKLLKGSYQATWKNKAIDVASTENPILELVLNYDCSQLRIGMIEFYETIKETEDSIFFGQFEIDELAINRISNEIVLFELGLDHIICYCASNGSNFLDAILIAAEFLNKRGVNKKMYNDEQLNIQMAEECGEAAGGEKYYGFYRMMFGV